jgi:hypothetical protein
MKDLKEYLNSLKDRLEIKSTLQFSVRLGIPQPTLHKIMNDGMLPSDETCEKIAKISGDRPEVIIALAHMSRAKAGQKKYWEHILKAVTREKIMKQKTTRQPNEKT